MARGFSVHVGNLPFDATEPELQALFNQAAECEGFKLITHRDSGKPRGFGYAYFRNAEGAQAAVDTFDGKDFKGRRLRVEVANSERRGGNNDGDGNPREGKGRGRDRGERGGGYGGGYGRQQGYASNANMQPVGQQGGEQQQYQDTTVNPNIPTSLPPQPPPGMPGGAQVYFQPPMGYPMMLPGGIPMAMAMPPQFAAGFPHMPMPPQQMLLPQHVTTMAPPQVPVPTPVAPSQPPQPSQPSSPQMSFDGLTNTQAFELVTQLKQVAVVAPQQCRQLLTENTDLTRQLAIGLLSMGLVDVATLQTLIKRMESAPPQQPQMMAPMYPGMQPPVPPPAAPAPPPDQQQRDLLRMVMELRQEDIDTLPPEDREKIMALRAQIMQAPA